jgi:hypothetical protein
LLTRDEFIDRIAAGFGETKHGLPSVSQELR